MVTFRTASTLNGVNENSLNLPKGIHLLGDFYNIESGLSEMLNANLLEDFCLKAVKDSGLTAVGRHFYQFEGAGVTGVVLLAESHIAIHTWPERKYLTLDIFVCNVTEDNTEKACKLYKKFKDLFLPGKVNYQKIERE